jgi:hypothetical protein
MLLYLVLYLEHPLSDNSFLLFFESLILLYFIILFNFLSSLSGLSDLIFQIILPRWTDLQRPKAVNLPSPRPRLQGARAVSASGAHTLGPPIPSTTGLLLFWQFSFLLFLYSYMNLRHSPLQLLCHSLLLINGKSS